MAHVGALGPVIFRRDFNLNVNNNAGGFFRRYLATLHQLPAGVANIVNGFQFDCGPEAYPDSKTITWESPLLLVPIFAFKVKLIAQINNGKNYFKGVELHQKNAGLIFAGHWPRLEDLQGPNFPFFTTLQLDFWNTDWFDSAPVNVTCEAPGKTWNDGPPH